jgi:hypothetical protein
MNAVEIHLMFHNGGASILRGRSWFARDHALLEATFSITISSHQHTPVAPFFSEGKGEDPRGRIAT